MWAVTAPLTDKFNGQTVKIGQIELISELTTSVFGDERLYFRHTRFWSDRQHYASGWAQYDQKFDKNDPD